MRFINWLDLMKERKKSKWTQLSLGVLQNKDAIYKNKEKNKTNLGYQEIHNLNFPELYRSKVTLMMKTQFSLALHCTLTPESNPHSHLHLHQEVWSASPLPHWVWLLLLGPAVTCWCCHYTLTPSCATDVVFRGLERIHLSPLHYSIQKNPQRRATYAPKY